MIENRYQVQDDKDLKNFTLLKAKTLHEINHSAINSKFIFSVKKNIWYNFIPTVCRRLQLMNV